MGEKEVEKQQIYEALDNILENLEVLESKTNKEKVAYLLNIQVIQTKLLYNSLKDIDDLQENILNLIKALRKQIINEDINLEHSEEEIPTNEEDLKKTESKIKKKTYELYI